MYHNVFMFKDGTTYCPGMDIRHGSNGGHTTAEDARKYRVSLTTDTRYCGVVKVKAHG